MEAVTRELRSGLPWELLYAYDLVLVATSKKELEEKLQRWKYGLETKGLKVSVEKTKWMMSGDCEINTDVSGRWPCAVCKTVEGKNSLRCQKCQT